MADLWYPGRIPLCTQEILPALRLYVHMLQDAVLHEDGNMVIQARGPQTHVLNFLTAEARACLGSDTDINGLIELLRNSYHAAAVCCQRNDWNSVAEIAEAIDEVFWGLHRKHELGGVDDGKEPQRVAPPEQPERCSPGSDGAESAEQEDGAELEDAYREAEEALQSGYDEEARLTEEDVA
jgi:hypothetical protein